MTNKYLEKIAGALQINPLKQNRYLTGLRRRAELTASKMEKVPPPGSNDLSKEILNKPLSKIAEYHKRDYTERLRRLRERRGETEEQFNAAISHNLNLVRKYHMNKYLEKIADIEIKKSHQGLLHDQLGIPPGEKIPEEKLHALLKSEDPTVRRRAQFAINARKWHHKSADWKEGLRYMHTAITGVAAGMALNDHLRHKRQMEERVRALETMHTQEVPAVIPPTQE